MICLKIRLQTKQIRLILAINKKLLTENADRLDSSPLALVESAKAQERALLSEALSILDEFEFTGGFADISEKNLLELDRLVNRLSQIIREGEFSQSVSSYLKSFDANARNAIEFLKGTFDEVPVTDKARNMLINNKRQSLDVLTGSGLNSVTANIRGQLNNSLAGMASKKEITEILTQLLVSSDERLSEITRHVSQNAYDRIAFSDRAFTQVMNEEIGAVWWIYFGGTSKDTRKFCQERNGRYWHTNEVQIWGDGKKSPGAKLKFPSGGKWQGKIPSTNAGNIFVNLGGYNCQHSMMPVSIFDVPVDVIQRNIASGNFTPTQNEKKLLNL